MKVREIVKQLWKGEVTFNDIYSYLQGNIRHYLYYSRFNFLVRKHIKEQFEIRVNSMNPECYRRGECVVCGCMTTNLQMASKACEGFCYPILLGKKAWNKFKKHEGIIINGQWWELMKKNCGPHTDKTKLIFVKLDTSKLIVKNN